MAFTNGATQALMWRTAEAGRLLADLIGAPRGPDSYRRAPAPRHVAGLCGWYRPRTQPTDMQAWSMFGAGGEVAVRRGQLILRALSPIPALYRGVPLHPDDDPSVFWIDLAQFGFGPAKVVFCSDAAAGTASLHLDLVPPSLERQPATTNPRY